MREMTPVSFGPNSTTKTAENNLGGASNAALNQLFPQVMAGGGQQLAGGGQNVQAGTNFFQSLLGGNAANTTAALQPSIDQIRGGTNANLNAISTLMPRGGGRSGALFQQSFEPQRQMQNLFNMGRTQAASTLPGIGLQQQGIGTNLFGIGQGTLGTAGGINTNLGQLGQQDRQISNSLFSGLGQGLFGLATTPFGGGSTTNGLLGLLGKR